MNDPFGISKKKDHDASGSAIAAGGAVTAGTGLVAGGIPGAKSDFSAVFRAKHGTGKGIKRVATTVTGAMPAYKAAPGGILGFRHSAHEGGTEHFRAQAAADAAKNGQTKADAFTRGRNLGKIPPEEVILRQMKGAKNLAGAALVGGLATTAYGVHRARHQTVAKSDSDRYNGVVAGGGLAASAVSIGGTRILNGQRRKWETAASGSVDQAGKLVPSIAGRQGVKLTLKQMHRHKLDHPNKPFPKSMYPDVSDHEIKTNPARLAGVDTKTAEKVGQLRGAATQQRHFAEVYGNTAKVVGRFRAPSLVAAAAGVGGLAVAHHEKDKLKKNDPFGIEISKARNLSQAQIDRRKKIQATTSVTTATLGLGGLGLLAAGHGAPKLVQTAQKAGRLKAMHPEAVLGFKEKAVEGAKTVGVVSGGIGGVGGYNFASYTRAEARQRKAAEKKVHA